MLELGTLCPQISGDQTMGTVTRMLSQGARALYALQIIAKMGTTVSMTAPRCAFRMGSKKVMHPFPYHLGVLTHRVPNPRVSTPHAASACLEKALGGEERWLETATGVIYPLVYKEAWSYSQHHLPLSKGCYLAHFRTILWIEIPQAHHPTGGERIMQISRRVGNRIIVL